MFKNQLVMHTMNDSKEFSFFLSPNSTFVVRKGRSLMERYEGELAKPAYTMYIKAWELAGIVPVKTTIKPLGGLNAPFWYSITYDLTVQLVAYYERELDYGEGEEAHEKVWQLSISKPLGDLDKAFGDYSTSFTEDFIEFLVSGLQDKGFQFDTPESSYSPTGNMFVRYGVHSNYTSRRLTVYNAWARDV